MNKSIHVFLRKEHVTRAMKLETRSLLEPLVVLLS